MIDDRPLAVALLGCTYKLDEYLYSTSASSTIEYLKKDNYE